MRPIRSNMRADQAEGLRRLLAWNRTRVVIVVAGKPGVGCTSTTINLAAAMAHSGKKVLVLDENHTPNNLLDQLGLYARYDLLDIIEEKCKPHEAVLSSKGFSVLSTARAMHTLAQLKHVEHQRLENALSKVSCGVDVMLVDAAMPVLMEPPAIRLGYQRTAARSLVMNKIEGSVAQAVVSLLMVVDATASGITGSYALIKRMALDNACLQFEIVVSNVFDEQAAMTVFSNMAKVARCNLAARLEYLGYIPQNERLKRATQQRKSVVDAFPTAALAKFYFELSQKLLHLPIQQNEAEGGVRTIIRKVPQPICEHNKKVAYDVNC